MGAKRRENALDPGRAVTVWSRYFHDTLLNSNSIGNDSFNKRKIKWRFLSKYRSSTKSMKNHQDTTRLCEIGAKPRKDLSALVGGRACLQSGTLSSFVPDRHATT